MPPLPSPRDGTLVLVRKRPLQFSYWPMRRGTRRYGLQATLFAVDPWVVIRESIQSQCPAVSKAEAAACLVQARDFYSAATAAHVTSARPLLYYYCFLNLAKAYVLKIGQHQTLDRGRHGLERVTPAGGKELSDSLLNAYTTPDKEGRPNVFAEFLRAISGQSMPQLKLALTALLPQVLPAHRLWAEGARKQERFVALHNVRFHEDKAAKKLWLCLYLLSDDLSRLVVTHERLLSGSRLDGLFREVKCSEKVDNRPVICLEQVAPLDYTHRAADAIPDLVRTIRQLLWTIVSSSPPYRRYYLYPAPVAEHDQVLPQLLSAYAIMYYLGSVTRYRPDHLGQVLRAEYGPLVEEFVSSQPLQFIYLMASEFAQREVTRPAIVQGVP